MTSDERCPPLPALAAVEELYEKSRFLDAYELTRSCWQHPEVADAMSVEELVLAGRLAFRLGASKGSRWLLRKAHARGPDHPLVRYYAQHALRARADLYETLADFDRTPRLDTDDHGLQASWLAYQAMYWLGVRDLPRAHGLIAQARDLEGERAWVDACEAQVLLADDRWDDALDVANRAFEAAPGMPGAAIALGRTLARLGRLEEAAERLGAQAMRGQSYEVAQAACWYTMTLAERAFPDGHQAWCKQARALIDRVVELAPLADREVRMMVALAKLDIAVVTGDRTLLEELPDAAHLPFVRTTLERLHEHPESDLFVLPIATIYQKHNTCLPASIGAALGGLGGDIDVDQLAGELTFGGTPSWDAATWLHERGFLTRHFIATPDLVRQLLKAGLPFVFAMEWDTSAHATTAMGLDEASDSLIVHDPSRERWVRLRMEALGEEEEPVGPKAMAVVPADKAQLLDLIPAAASEPLTAFFDYTKCLDRDGALAAEPLLASLMDAYPEHPLTAYMRAIHEANTDRLGDTLVRLQEMLQAWPRCLSVRRLLVGYLHRVGNTATLRAVLGELVNQKLLMGTHLGETWKYPPSTYICQYADLVSLSADQADDAIAILHEVIRRDPGEPEAYHVLGDVLCRQRRLGESVLAFRIAASLEAHNDHYAAALADVLRQLGREDEGLRWLRERAERHESRDRGVITWATLIQALQEYGHSEQAAELAGKVLDSHSDHEALLAFAVRFYVRLGDWEQARKWLASLKATGRRIAWLELQTFCDEWSGNWEQATTSCEQWLDELPDAIQAHALHLSFIARRDGRQVALDHARQLQDRYPGHDEYEYMVFDWLRRLYLDKEILDLLNQRLARNPDDAWAWRELAHRLMDEVGCLAIAPDDPRREPVRAAVEGCRRTCPDHEVTHLLLGRIREADGDREAAIEHYFQALEIEPEFTVAYRQIWEASASLPSERQAALQERLESCLLNTVGQLHAARDFALLIAERLGHEAALAAVRKWQAHRARDPELIEAEVDVLLETGEGRRDAARAIQIIKDAIRDFPAHRDLRFSLARAHMLLIEEQKEIAVWRDVLRRYPTHNPARLRLAVLLRQVEPTSEEPLQLLREAVRIDPLDEGAFDRLAQFLWESGAHADALTVLHDALVAMPEAVHLRENFVSCLFDVGDAEHAVEAAREGTEHFPDGAMCWLIYAQALRQSSLHSEPREVEKALRQALACNSELYEAADELAELLVDLRRWEEAREVMREQVPRLRDPSAARGRLAWIDRTEGQKEAATAAMITVVKDAPWYIWGWRQLMFWLLEDEDKDHVRELLEVTPAPLLDEPELRAQRLDLLEMAGTRASTLVPEWDKLLEDFPQHLGLYLRRFDRLWEERRFDEASRVLEKVERFHARDAFLLGRKSIICAHFFREEECRVIARQVWTMPGDDDVWPESTVFESLTQAAGKEAAVQEAVDLLKSGQRLRHKVLHDVVGMISVANEVTWRHAFNIKGKGAALRGQALLALLEMLDQVTWEASHHRAVVVEGFLHAQCPLVGLTWWRAHKELVDRQTPVWEAVARLLVECDTKQASAYMQDWRDRHGVGMFLVCNYVLVLRKFANGAKQRDDMLHAMQANAVDALSLLTPDHTALYLACTVAEAWLRLGDDDRFLAAMNAYRSLILDSEDSERWYMGELEHLPAALLAWEQLLLAADPEFIDAAIDVLDRYCGSRGTPRWMRQVTIRLCQRHRSPSTLKLQRLRWSLRRILRRSALD